MNITETNIIKILKKYGYNPKKIKRLKNSVANINYKFLSDNKYYVAKFYQREFYFELSNKLIQKLKNCNDNIVVKNRRIIDYDIRIEITDFIDGKHISHYSNKEITEMLKIINYYTRENEYIKNKEKRTIYNKFNNYYEYFKKNENNIKKVSQKVITELNTYYDNLNIRKDSNMCIIHGDLSTLNILWNNHKPIVLDFDESIYAHKEYEIASFIIKSSFNNSKLDEELAMNIINRAMDIIKGLNYKILKNYIIFYILKVLYEKLYYYEITDLDIESNEQKRDYWLWWYNLLINNQINRLFEKNKL